MPNVLRLLLMLLLSVAGGCAWWAMNRLSGLSVPLVTAVVGAAALALVPPIGHRIRKAMDVGRRPSHGRAALVAVALAAITTSSLIAYAKRHRMVTHAYIHDEAMILVQAQLLAHGRLWLPAHPCADFFESFYLFVRPVYASIYFPGAALLYAPSVWLKIDPAWWTCGVMGAIVGAAYLLVTDLIDGVAGLLAALLFGSIYYTRMLSVKVFSQPVLLLTSLLMSWAWLNWRRRRSGRWAMAMGAFAGWALVTRPQDALCFILPLAVASLCDLSRQRPNVWLQAVVACATGALPFIALQLCLNVGVTGHPLKTPASQYLQDQLPGVSLGARSHITPDLRPRSALPQMQQFYERFVAKAIQTYESLSPAQRLWRPVPVLAWACLPLPLLVVLALPGLLGLTDRRRAAVAAVSLCFVVTYATYPFMRGPYGLMNAPAVVVLILLGIEQWSKCLFPQSPGIPKGTAGVGGLANAKADPHLPAFSPEAPGEKAQRAHTALTLSVGAVAIYGIATFRPVAYWNSYALPVLTDVNRKLATIQDRRAVVLFTFSPGDDEHQEPTYNVDVAEIDRARIVRAHDLGPVRNRELAAYYAARQPDRIFYRYMICDRTLRRLGTASELAAP